MARDRTKLKAFHLAHAMAVTIHHATSRFPAADRETRTQIRSAALSAPANIAEGCARRSNREYCRFLNIALGSASEADYLVDFCFEVRLLDRAAYDGCKNYSLQTVKTLEKLIEAVERFDAQSRKRVADEP